MNTLYYGDNLDILKNYIRDETVDLIYLDPPFQSGKNYNQIFQPVALGVKGATSQIQAFEDTWNWGPEAEREYTELITGTLTTEPPSQKLIDLMKAMRGYLAECPLLAYLCMMAPRLVEMRRALKDTGSIYLHCDPTASHYLKLLMDAVFSPANYQNEIIWKRTSAHNTTSRRYGWVTDTLYFYSKSNKYFFNSPRVAHDENYIRQFYRFQGPDGRRYRLHLVERNRALGSRPNLIYEYNTYTPEYGWMMEKEKLKKLDKEGKLVWSGKGRPSRKIYLDEVKKPVVSNLWDDVTPIQATAQERLGYPTQKPETLLERIIKASSNEGDIVLDPFCGCGTTIAVAERLRRKWTGIDITYLSIDVIKKRLGKNHMKENEHFKVYGVPKDIYSAGKLAEQKPFEFEVWTISQLNATPTTKTGDKGVDGVINFIDNTKKEKIGKGIISVKGGHSINPGMVRDLKGTIQSQNADFGILVTLEKPTKGMIEEAVKEGSFDYCYQEGTIHKKIPKVQLLTVEDLFTDPIPVKLPPTVIEPYRKPDIKKDNGQQALLM